MQHIPAISVVMPVYNAGPYLETAVQSILRQTHRDFELIAVDDGSTDDSLHVLESFAAENNHLRIISRGNTGIVKALNDGIAEARGEFIARMDADDIAFPERLERQLAFMKDNPGCVAVGTGLLHIDSDGDPIRIDRWATNHAKIDGQLLQGGGGLAHPSTVIRLDALDRIGGYRPEYEWIEDKDLWLRLAEIGQLANLPDVLLAYRIHERRICWERKQEQNCLWQSLLKETYARRGLDLPVPPIRLFRKHSGSPSVIRRKWIRAAARNGYFKTASKHARYLVRNEPLAPGTWWTMARAMVSCLISSSLHSPRSIQSV
ncbi:MAG: glycosyltransferase [Pirellulales bacterium]|nr:glycosyltransferase [Pirellulales bacterium]